MNINKVISFLIPAIIISSSVGVKAQESEKSASPALRSEPATATAVSEAPNPYTVVIIAKQEPVSDPSSASYTVTSEELEKSPRPTLLEKLSQTVPGLYVNSRSVHGFSVSNGAAGSIKLRGLGGSPNTEILVLDDGIPDYAGIFGHPIPDIYLPDLVDSATVIAGGDSVRYGSNAMGGAIIISTIRPKAEGDSVFLYGDTGSFNAVTFQPAAVGKHGDFEYIASFRAEHSDGHRDYADFDSKAALAKLRLELGDHFAVGIRTKESWFETFDPGPFSHPYSDHWLDVFRANNALFAEHFHQGFSGKAIVYYNFGDHAIYDGFRSNDALSGSILEELISLKEFGKLRLIGEFRNVYGDAENVEDGSQFDMKDLRSLAFAQEYEPSLWKFDFILGVREHYSFTYGFLWLAKAGTVFHVTDDLELRARAARNFREPTLRELYLPFPVANPDLKPEISENYETGISKRFSKIGEIGATGYRTSAHDFIRYYGAYPSYYVENLNNYKIYGVEGYAELTVFKPLSFRISGMRNDNSIYTAQNPDRMAQFETAFSGERLYVSVSGEWIGGLYQKDYKNDPIDDIYFADFSIRHTFFEKRVELFLTIRNFTDSRYAYIKDYDMPGRNFTVGLILREK